MSAMFSGPTSRVSRAKTVLSERSVPLSIEIAPAYEWSYVSGHHAVGGSVSHEPVSEGSYLKGAERYVVDGLIPWAIAVVSTIVLKVDPGWRRADEAKLTWFCGFPGLISVIARIAPFVGLIETIAAAGSVEYGSVRLIALRANRCRRGSIVVYTFRPPVRTVLEPYCF